MSERAIAFPSKKLTLEGVLTTPDGLQGPLRVVVLCHSHPVLGGHMEHPLLVGIARLLRQQGVATLRFNFRGVGGSQGEFSNGQHEHEDALAALEVASRWPGLNSRKIAVVGYSFGAAVVLQAFRRFGKARAFVFISPPLAALERSGTLKDKRPRLFLVGDADRIVPASRLQELTGEAHDHQLQVVPGADHTWRGHEEEGAQATALFLGHLFAQGWGAPVVC